jgi:hypothetical protein
MQLSHNRDRQSGRPCGEHGTEPKGRHRWAIWLFPFSGLFALVWFLIRVIPKPSRATYPCQRLAFPIASGFVVWLVGGLASVKLFRKAKRSFGRSRYAVGALLVFVAVAVAALTQNLTTDRIVLADAPLANSPIGVAQGVHPGRVVWVHDPDATDWAGPGDGYWWQSNHTDQPVVDRMLSCAIRELTGETTDAAAWNKLFTYINQKRGKGEVGYQAGEKIAIKVNFVGFIWNSGGVNPNTYNLDSQRNYMNTSPQVMLALLRQLVRTVGAAESDISIGDSVTYFANEYYNILHNEFPDVQYVDFAGKFNRVQARRSKIPLYWSSRPQGTRQDFVPVHYAEAEYLINLANFKAHTGAGVTLCAKNHYGSIIRLPAESGYYDLHTSGFASGMGKYRNFVDFMGHAHVGKKTMLYLIDGLYAGVHPRDTAPLRWNSAPFNGDWTSSLFASQDPVAIDSVAFDFLWEEWSDYPHMSGTEDYLHEAALADNPPSRTFYDPDHSSDVQRLPSLGVHEHWNSAAERQYSRNLGTGDGIELIAVEGTFPTEFLVEGLQLNSEGTLSLRWENLGSKFVYSVEYADALTGGNWQLVPPIEQWPTSATTWTDALATGSPARFYRVKTIVPKSLSLR